MVRVVPLRDDAGLGLAPAIVRGHLCQLTVEVSVVTVCYFDYYREGEEEEAFNLNFIPLSGQEERESVANSGVLFK